METPFRVFGCYDWLVKKAFNLVAVDHRSSVFAASSITGVFHVINISHLTPLIDILDVFHIPILCHLFRLNEDAYRIISWNWESILGQ